MAPSAIVDKPAVSHFTGAVADVEILPIPARIPEKRAPEVQIPVRVKDLFNSALIERHRMITGSRTLDVLISVLVHFTVIAVPLTLSLIYTDTINLKQFTATFLVAPPPPPPAPPAASNIAKAAAPPRRVFINQGKLVAPRYIPEKVADIREAPMDSGLEGVVGGVPGGVPGGQMGGVIGGVLGGTGTVAVPQPSKPKAPVRVGGRIREPKLLYRPELQYPVLARQAHVSGVVVIDAVLDEQGHVVEMKVVSGPPLLYPAALSYLKEWRYEPTYLNEVPISVEMIVNVIFQLNTQ